MCLLCEIYSEDHANGYMFYDGSQRWYVYVVFFFRDWLGLCNSYCANRWESGIPLWKITFLALLDFVSRATVMAQASVVHPSVNSSFSETAAWVQTKFYGKLPIHHISRPFFSFFKIFNFQIFTIFFRFR